MRIRQADAPSASSSITPDTVAVTDLAGYIADMSGELALLAGRARWPLLTYFLNMARIEAEARMAIDAERKGLAPRVSPATDRRQRKRG